LEPISLVLSNTIGNVPAVVMILKVWQDIPQGTLVGLAILSTLAGNLFLVGSLANLIVAERASAQGVQLTFRDHAKAGVPITVLSMLFAGLWLWIGGYMPRSTGAATSTRGYSGFVASILIRGTTGAPSLASVAASSSGVAALVFGVDSR